MAFVDFTTTPSVPSDPNAGVPSGNGGNGGQNPPQPPTPPSNGGGINSIGAGKPVMTAGDESLVDELTINYNKKYASATPALFRDAVIDQTMGVLVAMNKPNPLLVGPAGTGKTKIVEEIARLIAIGDPRVPDRLAHSTIYELPLSNVVSGSSLVGELEEKVKAVIDFMCDKKNDAILFIDEVHQLAGHNEIYAKIAQILKPYMARGELRLIGATTTQEAQNLMGDPAFNRRFGRIIVDELTREQTITILTEAIPSFVNHYQSKIILNAELMETVAVIADRYHASGAHRPDTALTLLDRTCGEAIVDRKKLEANIAAEADDNVRQALQIQLMQTPQVLISEEALKRTAMRLMTGNAKEKVLLDGELKEAMRPVRGQDKALETVISAVEQDAKNIFPRERPLTMLFCGDSGVGKTEVARIIAETLCGTAPIYLNMCEYNEDAAINRIIGAPAGYVGYDTAGELPLDKLDSNPFQVIILDELEKGSKAVQRLFMGAFENGYIETSRGKVIDFSKATIIATTNAGHAGNTKRHMGFGEAQEENANADAIATLSSAFDIEFLNRFSTIVTFSQIEKDTYQEILRDAWRELAKQAKEDGRFSHIPDEISEETLERLTKETYVKELGARPAKRAVRAEIERVALDPALVATPAAPAGDSDD